jgi:hypothetical protein
MVTDNWLVLWPNTNGEIKANVIYTVVLKTSDFILAFETAATINGTAYRQDSLEEIRESLLSAFVDVDLD